MKDFKAFKNFRIVVEILNEHTVVMFVYYFYPYDCLQTVSI